MAVLIASNLRKELSGDPLFDGVSFKIERRDRVALSGPNGAGKTTLLRALMGETSLQGGELAFQKGTRVALHDQRPPLERRLTLREYVLSGATDLLTLEEELRRLEREMAAGDHSPATMSRYGTAQARLEHAGGYDWRERATAVVRGLGFADEQLDRRLETFSGGGLTRASLARALGGDPDLLLLDEPTNHLDIASLEWLEQELQSLDAGIILVAHDRWFLEAVTNGVLELSGGRSIYFAGPWHAWRIEKAARASAAGKTADRLGVDIARLERFVERFRYKKSKAKQAQAKLTQIGRLERERTQVTSQLESLTMRRKRLGFDFLDPPRSGRTVAETTGVELAAGDKRPQAQSLLGRFLFSGWQEQEKAVVKLSGGERRRLALALVVASGANFLLLDEPTNHLDLESRESLEAALEAFPGTILLVSHDRALLDAVAERTLAIEDGTVNSYDGGWAEYARRREEVASAPPKPPKTTPKRERPKPAAARPSELDRLE